MNGILLYRNRAREATAVTASSTKTGYHVNNVRDDVLGTTWERSGTGTTSYITFDLGSAQSITAWAIIGLVRGTSGLTTVDLKVGNPDDGSTFNVTVGTLNVNVDPYNLASSIMQTVTSTTKRYWRVVFTSGTGTFGIGEIALGTEMTFAECPDTPMPSDLFDQVVMSQTEGGAELAEVMGQAGFQTELNWSNTGTTLGISLPAYVKTYLGGRAYPACFVDHNTACGNPYTCRFCRVVTCRADEIAPGDRYCVRLVLKDVV